MQYIGSAGSGGASQVNLRTLREKVRQVDLPADVADSVMRELGASDLVVRAALDMLETVVSFLQDAPSGSGSGAHALDLSESLLCDYMSSFLLITPEHVRITLSLPTLHSTFATKISVKHVGALYAALHARSMQGKHELAFLDDAFAQPIDALVADEIAALLRPSSSSSSSAAAAGAPRLDIAECLAAMKQLSQYLNSYAPKLSLKDALGSVESETLEVDLSELDWFAQSFPAQLTLAHFVKFWDLLKAAVVVS
jgi:hypothetical protein